jgi:hypothetical protein
VAFDALSEFVPCGSQVGSRTVDSIRSLPKESGRIRVDTISSSAPACVGFVEKVGFGSERFEATFLILSRAWYR